MVHSDVGKWPQAKWEKIPQSYLHRRKRENTTWIASWREAILEVLISVRRFGDGVNYHLNCNHLLWWDHPCMLLLAPPLSIWHALATHTCTQLFELLHNTDHWVGRETKAMPPLEKLYFPGPHWHLLNRRQVMNWLWLPIINSAFEFMFEVTCSYETLIGGWMQFEPPTRKATIISSQAIRTGQQEEIQTLHWDDKNS